MKSPHETGAGEKGMSYQTVPIISPAPLLHHPAACELKRAIVFAASGGHIPPVSATRLLRALGLVSA